MRLRMWPSGPTTYAQYSCIFRPKGLEGREAQLTICRRHRNWVRNAQKRIWFPVGKPTICYRRQISASTKRFAQEHNSLVGSVEVAN